MSRAAPGTPNEGTPQGTLAPVTLVTGGVRGLGLAVARRLAARGDRVHVAWRSSAERAEALEPEFGERLHRADLDRDDEASALVERVLALDGRLDHVVHAVGDYVSGPLEEQGAADLERMFASNTTSAFRMACAARSALRASGHGRLVFFGCAGLAGLRARHRTAVYAAAKSALVVLARSLAVEEASHGVTVNVVSPGVLPHDAAHPDTNDPALAARIPAGRVGEPADAAAAVAWICSREAAYVTGADLPVAGGWML